VVRAPACPVRDASRFECASAVRLLVLDA